jgi:hypothetical protein
MSCTEITLIIICGAQTVFIYFMYHQLKDSVDALKDAIDTASWALDILASLLPNSEAIK